MSSGTERVNYSTRLHEKLNYKYSTVLHFNIVGGLKFISLHVINGTYSYVYSSCKNIQNFNINRNTVYGKQRTYMHVSLLEFVRHPNLLNLLLVVPCKNVLDTLLELYNSYK